jgi:uncharacterized protein (TIGR03118 family)
MYVKFLFGRRFKAFVGAFALSLFLIMPTTAFAQSGTAQPAHVVQGSYQQTNLVADQTGVAPATDPHLINPWGLAASATGPWWTSDNNSGFSTLYNGQGQIISLVVTVPPPGGSAAGTISAPTGIVFNSTTGFVVSKNGVSGAAAFIFSTEDGTISGWNPTVDRTHAILTVDRSKVGPGAVYKGLAIGSTSAGTFIYATNFRFGIVEVFDSNFYLVRFFTDPFLPRGFAPFGIQNIGGNLYVTFARQSADRHDSVAGRGLGFVDVFNTSGRLLRRLHSGGDLNAPWGLALAPANFGAFSNDLLVGNFGDGHTNVFDPKTGRDLGQLRTKSGAPIVIDGLWALEFGNGASAGAANSLFFTAGPQAETHGLFGKIDSVG